MKDALLNLMYTTGAFAPFRLAHRAQSLILTYHRFSASQQAHKTSAQTFAEHVRYLKKHYHLVPLAQIAEAVASGTGSAKLAAITIDDGHHDAYEIAYPILREYRVPATLFVVTDFLDGRNWLWTDKLRFVTMNTAFDQIDLTISGRRWQMVLNRTAARYEAAARLNSQLKKLPDEEKEKEITRIADCLKVQIPDSPPAEFAPISWAHARELDANSVSIGSHTVSHPILTNVDNARLAVELQASRERLREMLGHEIALFCYPNGAYDANIKDAVARAGYRYAVITKHGFNDENTDVFALRRFHDEPDLAHFVQTTSGFEAVRNQLRKALSASG